jgi:hypothetical protein
VGAICKLTRQEGKGVESKGDQSLPSPLTINVEYNQLEGLLGKGVKEPLIKGTNNSVYPGNINVLVFDAVQVCSLSFCLTPIKTAGLTRAVSCLVLLACSTARFLRRRRARSASS